MIRNKGSKKKCPVRSGRIQESEINYLNLDLLRKFLTESGRIVPSRITGVCNKYQHKLAQEIKYARYLALIEYCDRH